MRTRSLSLVFAVFSLFIGWSSDVAAISSCQLLAGPGVGPGDSQFCVTNGPTELSASFTNGTFTHAASNLSFPAGRISGTAAQSDAVGSARFGGEIIQDLRILGPASVSPIEVMFGLVVGGAISRDCINCSADLSGRLRVQNIEGPSLLLEASATTSTANAGDWTYNTRAFGPNSNASQLISVDPFHVGSILSFNAQSHIGSLLRVTINLSGNARINGLDPFGPDAITVDAANTNLFNIFLPAGYSLAPQNVAFLSNPQLLQPPHPVPLPGALWLLSGALALLGAPRHATAGARMHA